MSKKGRQFFQEKMGVTPSVVSPGVTHPSDATGSAKFVCWRVAPGAGQRAQQVVDNVDDIANSVNDAEWQASRLTSSYYALMAWVAVVTVAIVAVTAVTLLRRARRRPVTPALDAASISSAASSTSPPTIDAVERCNTPFDVTLPEVAEVTSASELRSDASATLCDDGGAS